MTVLDSNSTSVQDNTKTEAVKDETVLGSEKAVQDKEDEISKPKAEEKPSVSEEISYADFELPEGVTIQDTLKDEFVAVAKENKLTQESAQKFISLAAKHSQMILEQQQRLKDETAEKWVSEIKSDKVFGGEKFSETVERAIRARDKFGSPAFVSFLKESGAGNHPELIKLLARVDKAMGEGRTVDGSATTSQDFSLAQMMYPNQGTKTKK